MRIRNKIVVILLFISILYVDLFASEDLFCNEIFERYRIREELKSYKGWMRVCKNNKLDLYASVEMDQNEKDKICSCFAKDKGDRAINYFGKKE